MIRRASFFRGSSFFLFFFRKKTTKRGKQDSVLISTPNLFPLPLALRYLRAIEVGWPSRSSTVELYLRLHRKKRSMPLKGQLELPLPVRPHLKICVIAEGNPAKEAKELGVPIVGSEDIIKKILQNDINFDICLSHPDVFPLLEKVSKVPGAKRWMPSVKNGTVCSEIGRAIKMTMNGVRFREKDGVIRVPIGNICFTDSEIRSNLRMFLEHIGSFRKKGSAKTKSLITEIVLSSSHGMGIILDPRSI